MARAERKEMYRLLLATTIAAASLALGGTASAAGDFTSITPRFGQSPIVHYRVRFEVYDANAYCVLDEFGFYNDPACSDYDDGNATVDVRVFRIRAHSLKFVHQETIYGSHHRASEDLYDFQLRAPDYSRRPIPYRAIFRLIDPVTDRVVAKMSRSFAIYHH
jgi:hypothetical protein